MVGDPLIKTMKKKVHRKIKIIDSAVLALFYRDADDRLHMILIRRTLHGIHGGQIAFPGGKHEASDGSYEDTALRETEEEIGLSPESVEIISALPDVVTLSTKYRIHPFLARIQPPDQWKLSHDEVEELLDIPVQELTVPGNLRRGKEFLPGRNRFVDVNYYPINGYRLWGATFRIVQPLLPGLLNGKWRI